MKHKKSTYTLFSTLILMACSSFAVQLPLPSLDNSLVGTIISHQIKKGETIAGIARHYDVGYFELIEANPQINPRELHPGSMLIIPNRFILPPVARQGIIINLGTMRLFYFPKNKNYFYSYPVGIGKQDWGTPVGELSIIQKIPNPIWRVPKSIYDYRQAQGDPVPHFVLPGPDNPLGEFALRLSKPTYLIHGTNEPDSVGVRSSAGCIHLYPEDIQELFNNIEVGEKVVIINQPYQAGWSEKKFYIEAHLPLVEDRDKLTDASIDVLNTISSVVKISMQISWPLAEETIKDHTGIPTEVGTEK